MSRKFYAVIFALLSVALFQACGGDHSSTEEREKSGSHRAESASFETASKHFEDNRLEMSWFYKSHDPEKVRHSLSEAPEGRILKVDGELGHFSILKIKSKTDGRLYRVSEAGNSDLNILQRKLDEGETLVVIAGADQGLQPMQSPRVRLTPVTREKYRSLKPKRTRVFMPDEQNVVINPSDPEAAQNGVDRGDEEITVELRIAGDANGDGVAGRIENFTATNQSFPARTDVGHFYEVCFGASKGDPNYQLSCDPSGDGVVDVGDVSVVFQHWGTEIHFVKRYKSKDKSDLEDDPVNDAQEVDQKCPGFPDVLKDLDPSSSNPDYLVVNDCVNKWYSTENQQTPDAEFDVNRCGSQSGHTTGCADGGKTDTADLDRNSGYPEYKIPFDDSTNLTEPYYVTFKTVTSLGDTNPKEPGAETTLTEGQSQVVEIKPPSADDQPEITDITVPPQSKCTNENGTFEATVEGGDGDITYDWDFGGGATPNDPAPQTGLDTVTPELDQTPDDYAVTLTVTDADGDTDAASKNYVYGVPHIDHISASTSTPSKLTEDSHNIGTVGDANVEFFAEVSCGAPAAPNSHFWEFERGIITDSGNSTSTDARPVVELTESGRYTASLIVTNEAGEDSFPEGAADWAEYQIDPDLSSYELTGVTPDRKCYVDDGSGDDTANDGKQKFTVQEVNGSAASYEWSFRVREDDPATAITNEESYTRQLESPGTHFGTVTAFDSQGNQIGETRFRYGITYRDNSGEPTAVWGQFGHDAQNSHSSTFLGPSSQPSVNWSGPGPGNMPVIDHCGRIFAAVDEGIVGYHTDGSVLIRRGLDRVGHQKNVPAIIDVNGDVDLITLDSDCKVTRYDPRENEVVWGITTGTDCGHDRVVRGWAGHLKVADDGIVTTGYDGSRSKAKIWKLNANGTIQTGWPQTISRDSRVLIMHPSIDNNGDIYVAARLTADFDISSDKLPVGNLAKYKSDGTLRWVKNLNSSGSDLLPAAGFESPALLSDPNNENKVVIVRENFIDPLNGQSRSRIIAVATEPDMKSNPDPVDTLSSPASSEWVDPSSEFAVRDHKLIYFTGDHTGGSQCCFHIWSRPWSAQGFGQELYQTSVTLDLLNYTGLAVGGGGNTYFMTQKFVNGSDSNEINMISSYDSTGNLRWEFEGDTFLDAPVIGADSSIFYQNSALKKLK